MFTTFAIGGVTALSLLAVPATAAAGPAATAQVTTAQVTTVQGITIQQVALRGTGCATGSTVTTSADGTITVTFSDAYTARGDGTIRKNCALAIQATSPAGTGFTVSGVEYAGSSSVPAGASVSLNAAYFYAGNANQVALGHTLAGPQSGAWSAADTSASLAPLAADACGSSNLGINTSVLAPRGTAAAVSLRSATIHLTTVPC